MHILIFNLNNVLSFLGSSKIMYAALSIVPASSQAVAAIIAAIVC